MTKLLLSRRLKTLQTQRRQIESALASLRALLRISGDLVVGDEIRIDGGQTISEPNAAYLRSLPKEVGLCKVILKKRRLNPLGRKKTTTQYCLAETQYADLFLN